MVWVHAQSESDTALHLEAARLGAWVQFDGIAPGAVDRHVALVEGLRKAGLLHRVLVSHDAGWYHVGEPGGGNYRGYLTLFDQFLPALKKAGFGERERTALLVDHPRAALRTHLRLAG
jgi:phosphotriesterase-related protein